MWIVGRGRVGGGFCEMKWGWPMRIMVFRSVGGFILVVGAGNPTIDFKFFISGIDNKNVIERNFACLIPSLADKYIGLGESKWNTLSRMWLHRIRHKPHRTKPPFSNSPFRVSKQPPGIPN